MKLQLLRHATLFFEIGDQAYLVDPMLSPAEAWDPVSNSANPRRNPMVELPFDAAEMERRLGEISAVFVTHTHADHWDDPAKQQLNKQLPLFCQPHDAQSILDDGFTKVVPVSPQLSRDGIQIDLTGGQHGIGELAERIGPVSGFVIRAGGEPTLYIAGDTIWCAEVEQALDQYQPEVVVLNAGAAQFIDSDPITMTAGDVARVAKFAPQAQVLAVHMETINHCVLTRTALAEAMEAEGLADKVRIPKDGESIEL